MSDKLLESEEKLTNNIVQTKKSVSEFYQIRSLFFTEKTYITYCMSFKTYITYCMSFKT